MKLRWLVLFAIILPLALAACATESTLRFENNTDCGTATIQFTNANTGSAKEYRVEQGESVDIEIEQNVTYNYHLEYEGQPGQTMCDSKDATVQVSQRGRTTIDLRSATATPSGSEAPAVTQESEASATEATN